MWLPPRRRSEIRIQPTARSASTGYGPQVLVPSRFTPASASRETIRRPAQGDKSIAAFVRRVHRSAALASIALVWLAVLLALAIAWFGFVFPRTPGRMEEPTVGLIARLPLWDAVVRLPVAVPGTAPAVAEAVFVASIVAFVLYALAVAIAWLTASRRRSSRDLTAIAIAGAIVFFAIGVLSLPNRDRDIYAYAAYGRLVAAYHENPYTTPPASLPQDPVASLGDPRYTSLPDDKLPAWTIFGSAVATLGGGDPVSALLAFRTALFALNVASLGLIAMIVRRVRPALLVPALVIYGWNPIVAVHGESKTDTLMVFLLLLGALLVVAGRRRTAVVPLALSGLVKLMTGPLLILYWLGTLRLRRWGEAGVIAVVGLATAALVYAPFLRDPAILVDHAALIGRGGSILPPWTRPLVAIAFAVLVAGCAWYQDGRIATLFTGWAVIALFFSLFLTPIALGWYLMTLIALVAIQLDPRLVATTVALGAVSFVFTMRETAYSPSFPPPQVLPVARSEAYLGLVLAVALAVAVILLVRRRTAVWRLLPPR